MLSDNSMYINMKHFYNKELTCLQQFKNLSVLYFFHYFNKTAKCCLFRLCF